MGTEERITRFIETKLLDDVVLEVDPLASGMLDSLSTETLISWIEDSWKISFSDEDLVASKFSSVAALAALVDAKRGGASQ